MASLELRNQTCRVVVMFGGRKYGFSLDTRDPSTADALRGGEKTLMLIGQGILQVPNGADVARFVRNGGKVEEQQALALVAVTFATCRQKYFDTHRNGAMEAGSLATVEMHLNHCDRTLGERFHSLVFWWGMLPACPYGRARWKRTPQTLAADLCNEHLAMDEPTSRRERSSAAPSFRIEKCVVAHGSERWGQRPARLCC